jgi:hypothetical protein
MNRVDLAIIFTVIAIIFPNKLNMIYKTKPESKSVRTEWTVARLTEKKPEGMRIAGKPEVVKCKYGKAVAFNGSSDAIFLESMPLTELKQFTIEVIIQPQSGGNFEQRFLHCGETQGDRVLLELRSTQTDWYFDAFIKAGEQQCTLIDPGKLHPLDQWYHLAYVIDNGKLATYVNGIKELEGNVILSPLKGDKTSIGVRQNEVSWFKGAIYRIRITGKAMAPEDFMNY